MSTPALAVFSTQKTNFIAFARTNGANDEMIAAFEAADDYVFYGAMARFETVVGAGDLPGQPSARLQMWANDLYKETVGTAAAVLKALPNAQPVHFWMALLKIALVEREVHVARVREALASPDYSHATHGHSVSPGSITIYRRDPTSPTGVCSVVSFRKDDARCLALLGARSTVPGGMRGARA